jgi:hypothetical protein
LIAFIDNPLYVVWTTKQNADKIVKSFASTSFENEVCEKCVFVLKNIEINNAVSFARKRRILR